MNIEQTEMILMHRPVMANQTALDVGQCCLEAGLVTSPIHCQIIR